MKELPTDPNHRTDDRRRERRLKSRAILLATAGLLALLAAIYGIEAVGPEPAESGAWTLAVAATLLVQLALWLVPRLGWDRKLTWDRHYVYVPMTATALLFGLYILVAPDGRHAVLMAWFVGLLFTTGLVGFWGIVFLGSLMTVIYLATAWYQIETGIPHHLPTEVVEAMVFLGINAYAGTVFARIRGQRRRTRELREELARKAVTDSLTQLPNRRYLEEFLKAELARIDRYGGQCALALIDVDDFKHYNDTLGHMAGDEVLKELAELLQELTRVSDVAARYGGEEFAVIMVNVSREEAVRISRRLCRMVEAHDFDREEVQPSGHLTVSVGVASCPEDGSTFEELVTAADEALYAAKREGKNQVHAAA